MVYLILQMLFLLALAALAGAWLAWWYFRRRYEDVTSEYERLSLANDRLDVRKLNLPGREDMLKSFSDVREDLKGIRMPDMTPVQERLIRIEQALGNVRIPETNLNPVHERFTRIESRLSQDGPLLQRTFERLSVIEQGLGTIMKEVEPLRNVDLKPLQDRLDRLQGSFNTLRLPDVDIEPLRQDLMRVEMAIEELKDASPLIDFEPMTKSVGDVETRLVDFIDMRDAVRRTDVENIQMRLTAISSGIQGIKPMEMAPIQDRLARLEAAMRDLPQTDLEPVVDLLKRVDYSVSNVRVPDFDLKPVEERLARLEYMISNVKVPETDMGPVAYRLSQIESTIANIRVPATDLTPVADRLGQLEYRLSHLRLPETDLTPLQEQMRDLDSGNAALLTRLVSLEQAIQGLDRDVDLAPLSTRFGALESTLASMRSELRTGPDLSQLERRLGALQDQLTTAREPVRTAVPERLPPVQAVTTMKPLFDTPRGDNGQRLETRSAPRTAPSRPMDSIQAARRTDDRANLLVSAAFGPADDLERIDGVGPLLAELLNDIGVYYFWQVADWSGEEVDWVDSKLEHFRGRITRDDWVGQARTLARQPGVARRPG